MALIIFTIKYNFLLSSARILLSCKLTADGHMKIIIILTLLTLSTSIIANAKRKVLNRNCIDKINKVAKSFRTELSNGSSTVRINSITKSDLKAKVYNVNLAYGSYQMNLKVQQADSTCSIKNIETYTK
jgi:hypothetical protein